MSRQSIDATSPRLVFYIVLTCSTIRSSADVVDLLSRAPICVFGNRPLASTFLDILFVIIALRIFARMLRRVVSLYDPSFK